MSKEIREGDCIEEMRGLDEASVDAIVTDPPYGLEFMGKEWDSLWRRAGNVADVGRDDAFGRASRRTSPEYAAGRAAQEWHRAWATEALRVLKPGGHLLAFGGTRTYHRLACAVEDAGFEIRDSLIWLYGSGFPKSLNGEWGGTALKPGHEPIVMARKSLVGTVVQNFTEHGTGALNIDGCRIEGQPHAGGPHGVSIYGSDGNYEPGPNAPGNPAGRWPANVVLDEAAAAELDRQSGELIGSASASPGNESGEPASGIPFVGGRITSTYGDTGGASRFFYTAKASRGERNAGLDGFVEAKPHDNAGHVHADERAWDIPGSHSTARANHHPTVKPIALMRWLCRLVTPPSGLILDPFTGSGTTGCAALLEDFDFIGIEREAEYVEIAKARVDYWNRQPKQLELA